MRSLRYAENLLLDSCGWKVGNGASILAGSHKWVFGSFPVFCSNVLLRSGSTWKVNDFIDPISNTWNVFKVCRSFIASDAAKILSLEILEDFGSDHLFWKHTKSGCFTAKSGYACLQSRSGVEDSLSPHFSGMGHSFFKFLWAMNIPPKWTIFLWKILHNSLADKVSLRHRQMLDVSWCLWRDCNVEEDLYHIFRVCPLVVMVWRGCTLGLQSNFDGSISVQDWILFCI